ncbi:hypothetical protein LTR09_007991 [Extremus antarcticus]|uniref:Uncharacterized protein n=1 Tax=Extremus antarcticus TaxID=702011 RepID=A0AAJ0DIF5_9PEZI|nr:hypothetical protein LTR09_007991 [Extremus antarcticus]
MDTNPSELFSVEGMVVAISGGGTGIGLMMTQAFAAGGAAKVYIIGRRKDKLDETAKLSPNIVPLVGDVTSKESLCQIAEQIKQETGYVNLLCCNSGYMPPPIGVKSTDVSVQEYAKKALEQKTEDWVTTFSTNSVSVVFNTFAFLELLDAGNRKGNCAGRKSQVIVTSSIAGYLRVPGNFGAYPASKAVISMDELIDAATTHIVKHLSGTLAPYSIRVNAIAPGLFPSELAAGLIAQGGTKSDKEPTEEGAYEKSFIPAERLGKTDDIVGTLLYMASAAGAYLNGNVQVLDGGRISQLNGTY